MTDSNPNAFVQPQQTFNDPLTDLLRQGGRELIAKVVEAELQILLEQYSPNKLPDGRQAVVRNGYLPQPTVQTGIGDVKVKVPKVRDRSDDGVFQQSIVAALFETHQKHRRIAAIVVFERHLDR